MKLLIIGNMRHGKDAVAEILHKNFELTYMDSSKAASEIFLYDALKDKYGYTTPEECYLDRVNHRAEWYDMICEYNKKDKALLAKHILERTNIYVGMRDSREIKECLIQGLFDFVVGVYDPRKPHEPESSFNIDLWNDSDFIIPNGGSLLELESKVVKLFSRLERLSLLTMMQTLNEN